MAIKLLKKWKSSNIDVGNTVMEASRSPLSQSEHDFRFFAYARSHCVPHLVRASTYEPSLARLLIRLLSRNEVQLDIAVEDGRVLLSRAVVTGDDRLVRALTENGKVDVEAVDKDGQTVLLHASRNGDDVKVLIEAGKANVDAKDQNGRTPLSWAAGNGHDAVVKLLQPDSAPLSHS